MTLIRSLILNYSSEPKLGESLSQRLHDEAFTTETVSAPDTDPHKLEIAFVMTSPGVISFCCLAERRARISTYRIRLKLTNAFFVEEGRIDIIREFLTKTSQQEINSALAHPSGILSETATNELVTALSSIDAAFGEKFRLLIQALRLEDNRDGSNAAIIFEQERDAIGTALQIFNHAKKDELRQVRWSSRKTDPESATSALLGFKGQTEDEIVYHDLTHFPGMQAIRKSLRCSDF